MTGPKTNKPITTLQAVVVAAALNLAPNIALAAQTNAPKAETTPVKVERIATGLENPWSLTFLPDGRMLVTERPGRLRIITNDGKISKSVSGTPKVFATGQGGLLEVRLSPDFATTGTVFFSLAEPRGNGKAGTSVAKAKLVLESGSGHLEDLKIIFQQKPAVRTGHHFGSRIVIDKTGNLFVTTGDRGIMSAKAQDPSVPVGKVLRITPEGKPAPGNPGLDGWAPEVWSMGHRNLQGATLDPDTGALWTVEHGARGGDELNHPQKGKNYGWPVISYGRHYSGEKIGVGTHKEGMEQPVYYWDPSIATSGLAIYTGDLFPGWKGNFLVGGLRGSQIARLVMKNGEVVAEEKLLTDQGARFRDIRIGPDGAVYALTDATSGDLLRITPK